MENAALEPSCRDERRAGSFVAQQVPAEAEDSSNAVPEGVRQAPDPADLLLDLLFQWVQVQGHPRVVEDHDLEGHPNVADDSRDRSEPQHVTSEPCKAADVEVAGVGVEAHKSHKALESNHDGPKQAPATRTESKPPGVGEDLKPKQRRDNHSCVVLDLFPRSTCNIDVQMALEPAQPEAQEELDNWCGNAQCNP